MGKFTREFDISARVPSSLEPGAIFGVIYQIIMQGINLEIRFVADLALMDLNRPGEYWINLSIAESADLLYK